MKTCRRGSILRKGYTRHILNKKTNKTKTIRVPSGCIKPQSQSGLKRSDIDRKMIARQARIHKSIRKMYGTQRCKPGQIIREGYNRRPFTKKSGVHFGRIRVGPGCIKATGLSKKRGTKGKQLFTLKKGDLTKYGYHANLSDTARHEALRKSLSDRNTKPLSIFRKLNALFVLNKNKNPTMAKLYKNDSQWLQTTKEYQRTHPKRGGGDDLNESMSSIYSDYSIDELEQEYNKLLDLQEREPAQVEDFPEVKEELIRKYEDEIENLSRTPDISTNQTEAFEEKYVENSEDEDKPGSFQFDTSKAIDRNENKIIGIKRNIDLVKSEQEI